MFRNLLERLRATPAWVWITVAIAAAGLVISFLIYRQGNPSSNSQGSTQGGPVNPGDTTGGYSPYGNNSSQYQPDYATQSYLQQIVNLLQGQQQQQSQAAQPVTGAGSRTLTLNGPTLVNPDVNGGFGPPPSIAPHPVTGGQSPRVATAPAQRPIMGTVAHADDHRGTLPHPGAITITPTIGSYSQFRQNAK